MIHETTDHRPNNTFIEKLEKHVVSIQKISCFQKQKPWTTFSTKNIASHSTITSQQHSSN